MKRSLFLKRLGAAVGLAAIAPTALASEIKEDVKEFTTFPVPPPPPGPIELGKMIVMHDIKLPHHPAIDGAYFILPFNLNEFRHGDVITCGFNIPYLYVVEDAKWDEKNECWDYIVEMVPRMRGRRYDFYPRKYALPMTRYFKIHHAAPNAL